MARRSVVLLVALLAAALPILLANQPYYAGLAAYACVMALFGLSVNLVTGYLGLISFGHSAFFGLGSYGAGLLAVKLGLPLWPAMLLAPVAGFLAGALIGYATARLDGAYFAIATLTAAEILRLVVQNWTGLTRGPLGLILRKPKIAALENIGFTFHQYYLVAALLLLGLTIFVMRRLLDSPSGRGWQVIRDSAPLAESIGISVLRGRVVATALSGGFAALAGALLVPRTLVLTPELFAPTLSATGLLIVVLGGRGTLAGPVLGGIIFATLPEALRFIDVYRIAIFALILLLVVRLRPDGLAALFGLQRPAAVPTRPAAAQPLRFDPAPDLEVKAMGRRFGGLVAVEDVSFTLRSGAMVGLIGPNGAGKTTCLSMISGFLPVSAGSIRFGETTIGGTAPSRCVAAGLVRTFQQAAICGSRTVFDNVLAAAATGDRDGVKSAILRGPAWHRREATRIARAWACLDAVDLSARAGALAGSLPYGEQKMLSIAVALATRPKLLMLDEPAAGLNHTEANRLADLLRGLRDQGLTILLVDHNLRMMMALCDRILVLDRGRLIADGSAAEIQANPKVIEAYLGPHDAEVAHA
jgi:branched-chain amino acid transport system permease protein